MNRPPRDHDSSDLLTEVLRPLSGNRMLAFLLGLVGVLIVQLIVEALMSYAWSQGWV